MCCPNKCGHPSPSCSSSLHPIFYNNFFIICLIFRSLQQTDHKQAMVTATCVAFQKVCTTTPDQYHRSRTEKKDIEWPDLYPYEYLFSFSDSFEVTQPLLWYLHLHQVSSEQLFRRERILSYMLCCQFYELTLLAFLFEVSKLMCRFWSSSFMCRLFLQLIKMLLFMSSESTYFKKRLLVEQWFKCNSFLFLL